MIPEDYALTAFAGAMVLAGAALVSILVSGWRKFEARSNASEAALRPSQNEFFMRLGGSIVAVGAYCVVWIVGYTFVNETFAQPNLEPVAAQEEHIERMLQHEAEPDEVLEGRADEQHAKQYEQPHTEAKSTFESAVAKQRQAIEERNGLGDSQ